MDLLFFIRLGPKTRTDQEKLGPALTELIGKDPLFLFEQDPDSGLAVIHGTGKEPLEDIVERLTNEYGVEVDASEPQIAYREAIRKAAEAEGRYIRQFGGAGNYAHVKIRIEPTEPGKGFIFAQEIKGGVIPSKYFLPVEQGIRQAMRGGVLGGYEIVDVKVTLFDGSFHEVDSNELAFSIAGSMAFKEAARRAVPVVVEPIMGVEVVVPERHAENVVQELSSRRGRIESVADLGGLQIVKADVPLSEMSGYAHNVAVATDGQATWFMRFKRYEQRPVDGGGFDEGHPLGVRNPTGPRPGHLPANRARTEAD